MKRGNEKIGGCISAISTINKIMLKINECTFETNEAGSGGQMDEVLAKPANIQVIRAILQEMIDYKSQNGDGSF